MTTNRRDNLLATCSLLEDKLQRFIVTVAFPDSGKCLVVAARLAASPPSRETGNADADTIIVSIGYPPSIAIAELKQAIRGFLLDFVEKDPATSYTIAPRYMRIYATDAEYAIFPKTEPLHMDRNDQNFVKLGVRIDGVPGELSLRRELAWQWHEAIGNTELDPKLLVSLQEKIYQETEKRIDLPQRLRLFSKKEG